MSTHDTPYLWSTNTDPYLIRKNCRLLALPYKKWINPTSTTEWIIVTLNSVHDLGQVAVGSPFLWGVPKPKLTAKYTIRLDTANVTGAGTNADVDGRILSTNGNSAWRTLDNPVDEREKGDKDYYRLYFEDWLGDITGLELRVKKADESSPNWLLQTAWVARVQPPVVYEMTYGKWINPTSHTEWVFAKLDSLKQHPMSPPFNW